MEAWRLNQVDKPYIDAFNDLESRHLSLSDRSVVGAAVGLENSFAEASRIYLLVIHLSLSKHGCQDFKDSSRSILHRNDHSSHKPI
jgi:hypothetical protein